MELNPLRKALLLRALRSLAALLVAAGIAGLSSADFREFVANDPAYTIIVALIVPLLHVADKYLRYQK